MKKSWEVKAKLNILTKQFSASCSRSFEKKKKILFFREICTRIFCTIASSTRETGNIKSMGALKSILYNEECNDNIFFFFYVPIDIFSTSQNFRSKLSHPNFPRNFPFLAKYSIKNSKLFFSRTLDSSSCCSTPRRTYRISSNPLSRPYTNPLYWNRYRETANYPIVLEYSCA